MAAATRLVEAEGPAALTMRRLATELDVATTTIYWHVGSRDELVAEIVRLHSERMATRPITGRKPRQRIMSAATHVWDGCVQHPAITSLAHQAGVTALLQHRLEVALAVELEAADLTGPQAAVALRSILASVTGFLVLALRDESTVAPDQRSTALWARSDTDLDPSTVEALTAESDLTKLFEITVQAVVDSHL